MKDFKHEVSKSDPQLGKKIPELSEEEFKKLLNQGKKAE